MAGNYDIQVEGIDRTQIEVIIVKMRQTANRAARLAAIDTKARLKEKSPFYKGVLARSWVVKKNGNLSWGISSPINYLKAVVEGTGPGPRPFDPIAQWARYKGLPPGPVWWTIVHRGTKANDFVDAVSRIIEPRLNVYVEMAIRERGEL